MRNKVSREIKAEAIRLYMEGLSLRVIARKFRVSKESIRQWMLKFEEAFARKKLARKKERDAILLDETKVKRNGKMAFVTICLDLERREVVSSLASRSISSLSTINVVKQSLKSCRSTPVVITDHAPWYKYAFQSLGLCNIQRTFGFRNYIERWYRTFKQRTRRFFNNFPIRDPSRAIERIDRFLHLFAYWYNHMRPHETFKGRVPSALS
ncbi:MAG: IS6 family transposase [Nitrososphaerota archaeon]|nr:IS6 family transposase [Nitrososphaerota archaeon]